MVKPATGALVVGVGVAVGVTVGVADGVAVGVAVGVGSEPTTTCFDVEEEPLALVTVCVTVYVPGFGYVCAGFCVVAFGVLSPK